MLAFAKVSDAVAREDRREAEGEGPSNTLEGRSSGEFFEGHYVSEARVAFFRARVGWVDRLGVGSGGVVVVVGRRKGHTKGGKWVSRAEGHEAARGGVSSRSRNGGDRTLTRSVRYSSHGVERRTRREEGPRVTTDRPESAQKGKKRPPSKKESPWKPTVEKARKVKMVEK